MNPPLNAPAGIVGTRAPEFELPCVRSTGAPSTSARLSDYRDRWLVLMFYPRDFSLVCPTELTAMSVRLAEFVQRECDVLGISTDSPETHKRWIATPRSAGGLGGLDFPLASDESGSTCRAYGVYVPRQNVAMRGLFVIDPNGVIQYQVVHNLSVGRSVDELLRVIDALQSGGLCPEAWSSPASTIEPTKELGPNRVVGQYRIEEEIGRGGFGAVYRAWDTVLDRAVALKVLRSDVHRSAEQILNEARAAAALNHPHICTIHTVDSSSGVPVIVMELIDGQPVTEILAAGPMPRKDALQLARQIASGLSAAHRAGVVHGDLKPANILVRKDGVAKLMDFGLAHRIAPDDSLADTVIVDQRNSGGSITGTPFYMSPEQTRGQTASPASDVFCFGLILYELLTGHRAVTGESLLQALHAVNHIDIEALTDNLDANDGQLLRQLLCPSPAERMRSTRLAEMF